MTKAIISVGYTEYVLELKDAVTIAELLGKAEVYEEKYVRDGANTQHIYSNDKTMGTFKILSEPAYSMYKLAGKPIKD